MTWSPVHPALKLVGVEEPGLDGVAVEDAALEFVYGLWGLASRLGGQEGGRRGRNEMMEGRKDGRGGAGANVPLGRRPGP